MKTLTRKLINQRFWLLGVVSAALTSFSYFSQKSPAVGIFFLLIAQAGIMIDLLDDSVNSIARQTGFCRGKKTATWMVMAGFLGIVVAALYRNTLHQPLFPGHFTSFVFIAIGIGLMEELIYRGYFIGRLTGCSPIMIIALSTAAHTIYKAALFVDASPAHASFLMLGTFTVGALLGTARLLSKSIYPCLVLHGIFDLLVYGDRLSAPWWVW